MSDDSDGIEIIENKSRAGNDDICQLCPASLHGLSKVERNDHYDSHKVGSPVAKRARLKPTSVATPKQKTASMKLKKRRTGSAPQEDIFWHPAQVEAPPDNYTPGVLLILKEALKQSYKRGAIQRAVLCYERTPHILRESFDTGWGCGYRNFLMTCAALMNQQVQTLYFPHLDDPLSPSVRNLQQWLEDAWKHGYDAIGASQFEHKLVDTKKKIGTADLYVAFTSRKIPCILADFNLKNSPKGFDALREWVVNYFTEKPEGDVNKILRAVSPVVATGKMPIILQYEGHSVTIVGYELAKNGKYNLLVFDPSSQVDQRIRQAALNTSAGVEWTPPSSVLLGKSKRRDRSGSPVSKKRVRTNQDPDDGIFSIADSDEERDSTRQAAALKSTLDPDTVIKAFRLKGPGYKKNQYQLLYFTLGDPLSDTEQDNRKDVLSVAEC